jgi:uncharacterized protein YjbJ (UPF0337 family)
MGEFENKVEGTVKENVGGAIGDRSMEIEGAGQKAVGDAEGAMRHAEGKIEEVAGKVTGDRSAEVEGEVKQQG